ncbi:MAG: flagellar motor switch protein FliG [Alphaproteobacteria bacterium]|nr:flagellar motor switch protein FliG [Alphaproteobacteria bacterium]
MTELALAEDVNAIVTANTEAYDALSGRKKAAMLILAIGDDYARMLFDRLAIDEIKMITQEIAALGRIKGLEIEALLRQFNTVMGAGSGVVGSYDTAKKLLSQILDEDKVALIMKDIGGPPGGDVWEKLSKVDDSILANFLKNEYPQTVAVVLSKVKTDHAARIMSQLPNEIVIDAMMRMLRLDAVQEEVMTDVEDLLRVEFMVNAVGGPGRDHHEVMAEIFNYFDRTTETSFLEMLEERNKESAELIRSLMFTFDDLIKLDAQAIQLLLRNVDNSRLGLALKGAKDELKELFFNNMSERAAKILREDMENMGPVRVKDVEEAQSAIVIAAKALIDSGEITIASENDEDLIS